MQVFKFGGASLKDADSIKNVTSIIHKYKTGKLLVVVSAIGTTTNKLESIFDQAYNQIPYDDDFNKLKENHSNIIKDLAMLDSNPELKRYYQILDQIQKDLSSLNRLNYHKEYDQIISQGEMISSVIIAAYLNTNGSSANWINATEHIRTDSTFRAGDVDWAKTSSNIQKIDIQEDTVVTQGFVGSDEEGNTTTLGLEGSDYSAAIFGAYLNAESVTIWKDVPGILTADPKKFRNTTLIESLPYREASEMTYYGASIIHPKTIKPIAIKNIPLLVKSFKNPDTPGTIINNKRLNTELPCIITKGNQCLISYRVKDYTFLNQDNLAHIFGKYQESGIDISMMQNSAISISICSLYEKRKINWLIEELEQEFTVHYNTNLTLFTIKNYTVESLSIHKPEDSKVILEQKSRSNYRALIKDD